MDGKTGGKSMDKAEFEYMVNRCHIMYMQQNNNVMFNQPPGFPRYGTADEPFP